MASLIKFFLGAVVVLAIGVLSTRTELLPGSLAKAERRLQERSDAALSEAAPWAVVALEGQKAVIAGDAPSAGARDAATAAVKNASWTGGLILGGVTAVDYASVNVYDGPPIVDPFIWIAELQGDEILLSGYAPSQAARDALYQLTAMRFSDLDISGEIEIAGGAPPEDEWLNAVSFGLQALTRLTTGAVEADGAQFRISGIAQDASRVRVIEQVMASLPDGFESTVNVSVTAPAPVDSVEEAQPLENDELIALPPEPTPLDSPEPESAAAAQLTEIDQCRNRLRDAIAGGSISFPRGQRYVDDEARAYLRKVADQLNACAQFSLAIAGHTDASGNERRNRQLSLYRADTVAAYLRSVGVDPSRLETRGAGSAEPISANDTEEGRARNRRIELSIIFDPPQ